MVQKRQTLQTLVNASLHQSTQSAITILNDVVKLARQPSPDMNEHTGPKMLLALSERMCCPSGVYMLIDLVGI